MQVANTEMSIKMADAKTTDIVENIEVDSDATGERIAQDVAGAIAGLNDANSSFYSSIKGTDWAARKAIAGAITTSTPIATVLGKTINLVNIIVQMVQIADRETAEVNDAPRVILIDADGTAYHATSAGLLSAIRNILATMGEPSDWPEPLPIVVKEERGRNNYRFMTIQFA
jgi:hypothetical protein